MSDTEQETPRIAIVEPETAEELVTRIIHQQQEEVAPSEAAENIASVPVHGGGFDLRRISSNGDKATVENLSPGTYVMVDGEGGRVERYLGCVTEPRAVFFRAGGVPKLCYVAMEYGGHHRYTTLDQGAGRVDLTHESDGWTVGDVQTGQHSPVQDCDFNGMTVYGGEVSKFTPLYPVACNGQFLVFDQAASTAGKLVMRDPLRRECYIETDWEAGTHTAHLGFHPYTNVETVKTSSEDVTFPWEVTAWEHVSGNTHIKADCSAPTPAGEEDHWVDIAPAYELWFRLLDGPVNPGTVGIMGAGFMPGWDRGVLHNLGWNKGTVLEDVQTSHPKWEARVVDVNGHPVDDPHGNSRIAHFQGNADSPLDAFGYIAMDLNKVRRIGITVKPLQ